MESYEFDLRHFGGPVRLPWHPDDVRVAFGVLKLALPADLTTAGAHDEVEDAFKRALLALSNQLDRRPSDDLEAQYRYDRARGVQPREEV